tara:strand:- start:263 stop:601 length:339 start_codon:yes stop_codon:yes gene_type:complete
MSESSQGKLQNFTIDQFAGSAALIIGSIGALLTIIWQSRCLCRCRIGLSDQCYIFDCSREPPPIVVEEEASNILKKEDKNLKKEDEILKIQSPDNPRMSREVEPEPEPELIP